jgi:hypothetical protein
MSLTETLRNDAADLLIDGSPLATQDYQSYIDYFFKSRDEIYRLLGINEYEMPYKKFYENFDFINNYKNFFSNPSFLATWNSMGFGRTKGALNRWFKGSLQEFMKKYYKTYAGNRAKSFKPILDNILALGADVEKEKRLDKLTIKQEKEKAKLLENLDRSRSDIISIEEEINQLRKDRPPGYKGLIDELEKRKSDKLLLINDINSSISNIDKLLLKEIQEREKAQRVTAAERRRKYKIMAQESNKLAKEIQKTIERVAAEGFGNGEYQYTGRGMKKQKSKKKVMKKASEKVKKGGRYFEDPKEEVVYILKRLADLMEEGDLEHIDIIAKKLRKVKKIGRGKYYVLDKEFEEYDGGKMKKMSKKKRGGISGKVDKPVRVMSEKQKQWMDLIDKVQKKHPNLSRKECMTIASEKRKKSMSQ